MKRLFTYSTFIFLFFASCVKNNPDPAWIYITKWDLVENPNLGTEKELTQNFSDVSISIDDNIIGIFELPIKLPILMEGNHKITIYPVVLNNGISDTKKIYPFCYEYIITANLVKNETLTINPVTKYKDGTKFWIEDFEDASLKIVDDVNSNAFLVRESDPLILKYGNAYGHVPLTTSDSLWRGLTTSNLNLPKGGAEVYLEIDFMNTNSVLTGVIAYDANGSKDNPNIQLNPQDASTMVWKKIYIDLHEIVSFSTSATKFEHYLMSVIDEGKSQADVYIDNIKIVYF
ncbi:MAG: hypothetical protein V4622_04985 [Bacteroidota bacterium]